LDKMREPIIHTAEQLLPEDMPFFAAIDDTLTSKSGRKVVGASDLSPVLVPLTV
jgi:hypothetical protein